MNPIPDIEYKLTKEKQANKSYNYIVSDEWLEHAYKRYIKLIFKYNEDLTDFLESYNPEIDGTILYLIAKQQNKILEEGWEHTN